MLNNLRTRRFASCPVEQTQAIVVFQLGQQAFGLPIAAVRRVIPLETVYGNAQQQGLCLAQHLDQDVVLLDVKLCLLGQAVTTPMGTDDQPAGQYLLLLNVSGEEQMGLPIEGEPQIVRLPESALAPIPETYRRKGNVRCLSSRMAKIEGRAPILLLEAETLVENYLDWLAAQPTAKPKSSVSNAVDVLLARDTHLETAREQQAPNEAVINGSLRSATEAAADELASELGVPPEIHHNATEAAIVPTPSKARDGVDSSPTSAEDLPHTVNPELPDFDLFIASLPENIL